MNKFVKNQITYWLKSAAFDLPVADSLYAKNHFSWCLFIGHLVVEKVLKAIYVRDNNKVPPKTHNLIRLAQSTTLNFTEEKMIQLDRINDFNMEARYPDDKLSFYKICSEEFTKENLEIIKEMYNWLKSQIQLPT